jgi:hypothetical protein
VPGLASEVGSMARKWSAVRSALLREERGGCLPGMSFLRLQIDSVVRNVVGKPRRDSKRKIDDFDFYSRLFALISGVH